jgi:hypothetical protein
MLLALRGAHSSHRGAALCAVSHQIHGQIT